MTVIDPTLTDELQVEDVDPGWPTDEELAEAGFHVEDELPYDNDGNPVYPE